MLDFPDLVVEAFDESQADFVIDVTIGCYAVPMGIDHRSELLERLQTLPLQGVTPLVEETPCPARNFVAPQLLERILEKVSGVKAVVRFE